MDNTKNMKFHSVCFAIVLIGCAKSKPIFENHESRGRLIEKVSDSSFTFDIRNKVLYGEFFNLLAAAAPKINPEVRFISVNFRMRTGEFYRFRTYLPQRRKPGEPVDSSLFFITFGKTGSEKRPAYFLEYDEKTFENMSIEKANSKIDSLKQDGKFENFLAIMASAEMDMESEVIPILKTVQRFDILKNSFSVYVQK